MNIKEMNFKTVLEAGFFYHFFLCFLVRTFFLKDFKLIEKQLKKMVRERRDMLLPREVQPGWKEILNEGFQLFLGHSK
jgi:hypothetical protein